MKKETKTRIKFEDGKEISIELFDFDFRKLKLFLEKNAGLKYGKGDFYAQTIGIWEAWRVGHFPDHKLFHEFLFNAMLMISHSIAEKIGGYIAIYESGNDSEFLIYVPDSKRDYVILMEEITKNIFERQYDLSNCIVHVEIIGAKITLNKLQEQLMAAVNSEDYELATKLRDKINTKTKK
jgi:hypothetical protein